jgi:hypothetical protein
MFDFLLGTKTESNTASRSILVSSFLPKCCVAELGAEGRSWPYRDVHLGSYFQYLASDLSTSKRLVSTCL